jgi:hypothetical protein
MTAEERGINNQQEAAEWRRDILNIFWIWLREGHNAAEEQLDVVSRRIVNSRLASVRVTWRAAARLADCYLTNEQGDLVDVVAELHKRADEVGGEDV